MVPDHKDESLIEVFGNFCKEQNVAVKEICSNPPIFWQSNNNLRHKSNHKSNRFGPPKIEQTGAGEGLCHESIVFIR